MKMSNLLKTLITLLVGVPSKTFTATTSSPALKEWTIIVYMAADNNLYYFSRQNLEGMKNVGSNDKINILAQIDHRGEHITPDRLYIEKNAIIPCPYDQGFGEGKIDFGQVETLVDCMRWAKTYYPAKHYMLVLWNHGIGAVDSIVGKAVNSSELFVFNPATALLELNRSIGFLDYFADDNQKKRGICFSDTYATYITNQKLEEALKRIYNEVLDNKKLDILAFDACLMAMVEIASLAAPYSDIMVGSQEVELGTGWPYEHILKKVAENSLTPEEFATHIVESYAGYYHYITNDYTQSAVNLEHIPELENNILEFVQHVSPYIKNASYQKLNKLIKACKSKKFCTSFSEPSYVDFYHFYNNLLENIDLLETEPIFEKEWCQYLKAILRQGLELVHKMVIKNCVGKNLHRAQGLSIYFPHYKVHNSYINTPFSGKTAWLSFLYSLL